MRWFSAARWFLLAALACHPSTWAQDPANPRVPQPKPAEQATKPAEDSKRIELNLLGKTDTDAGENRRNENIQFNLVDNNALKELNVRLGTTATIIPDFSPSRNYFGAEFGNVPYQPNILDPSILGRTVGNPDTSALLLPRSAFGFMQPTDPRGNLGRTTFRKGTIRNVNAALTRTWEAGPGMRFSFRAESINLFNTPQFAEPGTDVVSGNFGHITNTLNDGRTFRFQFQAAW